MIDKELIEIWDAIIEYGIATEKELQLVTDINGYNERTLNNVIFARTAYRDLEQFEECEINEEVLR